MLKCDMLHGIAHMQIRSTWECMSWLIFLALLSYTVARLWIRVRMFLVEACITCSIFSYTPWWAKQCVCVCVCVRVCLLSKDGGNRGMMTPSKIDGMEMLYKCERDRACAHASMYRHKVSHTCTQCCDNLHTYMHMHIRTHTCVQIWRNKYNNKAPWGGRPRREE